MREKLLHEKASYLRDAVFSASDGIVTTFAVVAGSAGASLDPSIVVILGFANLFADGFSMSAGTYLGVKSEIEYEKAEGDSHTESATPWRQALITFISFDIAGFFPLIPYVFNIENKFALSIFVVGFLLFVVGTLRGRYTKKGVIRSGLETLFVGGFAAIVAYLSGFVIRNYIV